MRQAGAMPSAKNLSRIVFLLGLIAVLTGVASVLGGSNVIHDAGEPGANVESELRFFSVWWAGAGLWLMALSRNIAERGAELRVFCLLLFGAGIARILAIADTDLPSAMYVVFMVIELVLPVVLVFWQARVARGRSAA